MLQLHSDSKAGSMTCAQAPHTFAETVSFSAQKPSLGLLLMYDSLHRHIAYIGAVSISAPVSCLFYAKYRHLSRPMIGLFLMYNNTLRLHGENHTERSAFSVKSIILFCNCNLYFFKKPIGCVAVNSTITFLFSPDDTGFGNRCNRRV